MAEERITDKELLRWLYRSQDRLKGYAEAGLAVQREADVISQSEYEGGHKWIAWHDSLVEECVRRGILPKVPVTVRTEIGKRGGAF